jgi:hypothetical protein
MKNIFEQKEKPKDDAMDTLWKDVISLSTRNYDKEKEQEALTKIGLINNKAMLFDVITYIIQMEQEIPDMSEEQKTALDKIMLTINNLLEKAA